MNKQQYIKKIVKQGTSHYVLVPKSVIETLNLKESDKVKITVEKVEVE